MTDRHRQVLNAVVHQFVLTAQPVGSLTLASNALTVSSATVRNVMAELETAGLLTHSHVSSGRVPTALGYRVFVDSITQPHIDQKIQDQIQRDVEEIPAQSQEILSRFASILASASRLITVVLSLRLDRGVLERIELIPIADERLLLVVSLSEGMIKTILIELPMRVSAAEVIGLNRLMNERLNGIKLSDLQREADVRLADTGLAHSELVRLILNSADSLFAESTPSIAGTGNALAQPEFRNPDKMKAVIELLEGSDILLHLLEHDESSVIVKIGEETSNPTTRELSCVTANYCVGDLTGTIGIIGPTRMDYPRHMALAGFAASILTKLHTHTRV